MDNNSSLENHIIACKNEYAFLIDSKICIIGIAFLIGITSGLLTIMAINDSNVSALNPSVFTLYLSIVIVLITIHYLGKFGIIVAFISSLFFCIALKLNEIQMIYNIAVNVFQALLIYLFIGNCYDISKLAKDEIRVMDIIIFITGVSYIVMAFSGKHTKWSLLAFSIGILLCYIFFSIIDKKIKKIEYLLLICLLPNAISAFLNSLYMDNTWRFNNFDVNIFIFWTATNFILLSSLGYIFLVFLPLKSNEKHSKTQLPSIIKISTILFYISLIFWNLLFFIMHLNRWLSINTPTYIFPWLIGNIFFVANLLTSQKKEYESNITSEIFNWYEKRAIVAEQNTHMLIQIIALLLPISAAIMDRPLPHSIVLIFVLNISTAVASIGLIWIPQNDIKMIALIKTLKTIFHLLTISLLLLSTIMIVNNALIQKPVPPTNNYQFSAPLYLTPQ